MQASEPARHEISRRLGSGGPKQREVRIGIGPMPQGGKPRRTQLICKLVNGPFVGIFGVNGFVLFKMALPPLPLHNEVMLGFQVHFDA